MKFRQGLAPSLLLLTALALSSLHPTSSEKNSTQTENISGYCDSKLSCTCIKNRKRSIVHCKEQVDIMSELKIFFPAFKDEIGNAIQTEVSSRCHPNASGDPLENLSLLDLDPDSENEIILKTFNCPLSAQPYASLFVSNDHLKNISLSRLLITCGTVSNFSITAAHLAGLHGLDRLSIQCQALKMLPQDLLRDISKNVTQLYIDDTNIDLIPNNFFPNFTKLRTLSLTGNKLTHIFKNTFLGVGDELGDLYLSNNYISHVDDESFLPIKNITVLDISGNRLSVLPSSLGKLSRLTSLVADNNEFTLTDEGDFIRLISMRFLYFRHNRIKHLYSKMFSSNVNILYIELSNNSVGESISFTTKANRLSGNVTLTSSKSHNQIEHSASLPEDLFSKNPSLRTLRMDRNALISLPEKIFLNNTQLTFLNLSSNALINLPDVLFETNTELKILDLSNNFITEFSETFLHSQKNLIKLDLSNNKIKYLGTDFFRELKSIEIICLNNNLLQILPNEIFSYFDRRRLISLNLHDNALTSLPNLTLPYVTHLRLERNKIETIGRNAFSNMKSLVHLDCSNNLIKDIQRHAFHIESQSLRSINLANNMLTSVSEDWFRWSYIPKNNAIHLYLNFSGNLLDRLKLTTEIEMTIFRTESLDLSRNNLTHFGRYNDYGRLISEESGLQVKHLDLSNNRIRSVDSARNFDFIRKTWGLTSGFEEFFLLEVLNLANNEIEEIPMDWRNALPRLRLLDLSHNRIKYLWHQDLLFSTGNVLGFSTSPYTSAALESTWTYDEYPCTLNLTVDLRHNLIAGIELPEPVLKKVPDECEKDRLFSHATLLLGHNPFVCDCQTFNVLRYAAKEIRPTAELERSEGFKLVRPARIDLEGLACSEPITARGKQLSEAGMNDLSALKEICSLTH